MHWKMNPLMTPETWKIWECLPQIKAATTAHTLLSVQSAATAMDSPVLEQMSDELEL